MELSKFIKIMASSLLIIVVLTGCNETVTKDEYDAMAQDKDQRISELEEEVSQLKDHISTLETKTEEVNNQFDRLQNENWRDVVPDAESSLDDLNNEINNTADISTY